jgi:bifunctional non-homologous end joining protein LigD
VPAHLDGEERNWLIVRAAKDSAAGPAREYAPMRARPAKRVPSGDDWAFEIAWDGVRALAPMEATRARFEHASGEQPDERYAQLLGRFPRALRTSECVLDGVIGVFDQTVVYVVFDLLELEAAPLVDEPWSARRELLSALLDERVPEVRLSRSYEDGSALRAAARGQGLGIVAKRLDSPYRPGSVSDDWRLLG